MPWQICPLEEASVPIGQEAGLAPGPVWTGLQKTKISATTEVQTLNRQACNDSLYQTLSLTHV